MWLVYGVKGPRKFVIKIIRAITQTVTKINSIASIKTNFIKTQILSETNPIQNNRISFLVNIYFSFLSFYI